MIQRVRNSDKVKTTEYVVFASQMRNLSLQQLIDEAQESGVPNDSIRLAIGWNVLSVGEANVARMKLLKLIREARGIKKYESD